MRLLDLFSGAGGSAVGYHRAGFEVVGVDHRPQPHFPFAFVQADALEYLAEHGREFDVIHASPPCQAYSAATVMHPREYPRLIDPLRGLLLAAHRPYVIENVMGAPLLEPIVLCGLMFGLKVFRHRLFESNLFLMQPPHTPHGNRRIGRDGYCCVVASGDAGKGRKVNALHRRKVTWEAAMGIDWMTKTELTQAIPPAYTEFVGRQLRPAPARRDGLTCGAPS